VSPAGRIPDHDRAVGVLVELPVVGEGPAKAVHYVTTNLRGYEGHFGVSTLRVVVAPRENAS
jgi:hypothetical protein